MGATGAPGARVQKVRDLAQGLSELCMNWEEARVVAPWYDVSEVLVT